MRRPSRRVLPTVIGVSVVTTLATNVAVVVAHSQGSGPAERPGGRESFVAASSGSRLAPSAVAPLKKRLTPDLLVAAPASLPADAAAKVQGVKGVRAAEVVDAAQALVAGKRVGLLGVEPSTFRAFTPRPTAESDALWRNVAAGDVAISFTMGSDGGVKLGSQVPIGGRQRQTQTRVGAYATMGIGEIDAVVSRPTAQSLGVPGGNAILISAPKTDLTKLTRQLRRVLPRQARTLRLNPQLDTPSARTGALPRARGQVLTRTQVMVAIQAAQSKLGMPYVWGGESDSEGGYDCSGLMQYAFARAGVRLPRVAADQARAGWVIPFSKAQPGDLLTWANDPTAPGYISHIALYIGGGRMVVAPRTGDVVKIAPVNFNNFKGAIRINPRYAG
ncbi:C40 family peptidase [Actinomadura sp. HBU206391]|uniref:C40 family peptidase n=1 Tax=Actinomadura sp. HBU206391 TaxID=2731692 RepID=UPI00164FA9A0|nr:C40 family peptidase [Actinomadura sp. HBU206391]MBC6457557.1 C40 family peptidase [Actinomadura sp. HBU206391]